MKQIAAFACALALQTANAQPLTCYENPSTDARICFAQSRMKQVGEWRRSPLYMGGPNRVTQTAYTIETHCAQNLVKLRDSAGVVFAGGSAMDLRQLRHLAQWMCEAKIK